jgi:hypothetical protein
MTDVRKLRPREIVPRTEHPNFRDSGKLVTGPLLNVLGSLQKRHGEAFASEGGLRKMICEDTGHMPGVDTVATALERLEAEGLIAQEWLMAGGIKPDGSQCGRGTRLIRLAANRRERFAFAARARSRNRREGITRRIDHHALRTLTQARASITSQVAPPPNPQQDFERARNEALAMAAELAEQWSRERPKKPPD